MIEPSSQKAIKEAVANCVRADQDTLLGLRKEIRLHLTDVRRVEKRSATSISLVGTDGGNNQLRFDPLLVQIIRVVDSSSREHCIEVVSPSTSIDEIDRRQIASNGKPITPLGEMMQMLGTRSIADLSHMIRPGNGSRARSPRWIDAYRELSEWATLLKLLSKEYGTDTLFVFDGLLRSLAFAEDHFARLRDEIWSRIKFAHRKSRRNIYLVGLAKKSKVLDRYRLAISLEGILKKKYPAYVEVPRELETHAYISPRYASDSNLPLAAGTKSSKFVAGRMFLVKFGGLPNDPIWPVDVFTKQSGQSSKIIGSLLDDAESGFPVPFYPRCLQKAHECAALTGLDVDIVQAHILECLRSNLGEEGKHLDEFLLQDRDPAQGRYG